jgi:hypothetical protein
VGAAAAAASALPFEAVPVDFGKKKKKPRKVTALGMLEPLRGTFSEM